VSAEQAVAVVASLEDRAATGRGIRIEFLRSHDRHAHRILAVGCEELPVPLLASVEGTAEEPWPPSPAFQAINLEDLPDREESAESPRAAMLVGMSGSTHWSMCVKPLSRMSTAEDSPARTGFFFDAAGRLKSAPKVLSTRYSVGKRVRAKQMSNGTLLHFGSGQCRLDTCAPDGTGDPTGWQLADRGCELRHELRPDRFSSQLPATIRWAYALHLLDG
jgi:hypothetical protein